MPRELTRKLVDNKGHLWCLAIPSEDVNADSVVEIIHAAHDGIVRLLGYKLDGDEGYRLPADNSIVQNAKAFSFFKRLPVEGVEQEDFAEAMQALIDKAKESKIGKPKVTTWEGKPILFDERGPYIKWALPCNMCEKPIDGIKRISQSEGQYTRSQAFTPFDDKVVQLRPGSKHKVCSSCAPTHLHPSEAGLPFPTVEEVKVEAQIKAVEAEKEEVKAVVSRKKDVLDELMDLAKPNSDIDPVFLKGMLYGYLKANKTKGD